MRHTSQNDFILDTSHAPFNQSYLKKLHEITNRALDTNRRTMAVILILRLPEYRDIGDSISSMPNIKPGLFSRFIESLNAKINVHQKYQRLRGLQVYPCRISYAWVKEYSEDGKPHYHAVLFINKDTFYSLGDFTRRDENLGSFIQNAWCSALGLQYISEYRTLVHFPVRPLYYLNSNADNFAEIYQALTFRLSYLAKERSKLYSKEDRSFGCSQRSHYIGKIE